MPGNDPIDLVHLASQTGGDNELAQELLDLFADQCIKHLATIRQADAKTGSEAAHTLKGAALAIGAWTVAEAASRVERSLVGHANAQGLPELARAADEARAAIASMARAA